MPQVLKDKKKDEGITFDEGISFDEDPGISFDEDPGISFDEGITFDEDAGITFDEGISFDAPAEQQAEAPAEEPQVAKTQLEKDVEQHGAWNPAPPISKWDEFSHWFRKQITPFIGPSERQIAEEGVMWTDVATGQKGLVYKPLADKFTKQGLFNTPLIGDLEEKVGINPKDLEEFGVSKKWAEGIAGTQLGILDATEQVTNPLMGMAAAASGGAPLIGRILAAGFGVHMTSGLKGGGDWLAPGSWDIVESYNAAIDAGDTQTAARALPGGVLQAFFAAKATPHAFGKGIALESPPLRRLLTRRITEDHTPTQLRAIYDRVVNRGTGTPAEVELVKYLNREMTSVKPLLKKGVKEIRVPKMESRFWKDYLGLEDVKMPLLVREVQRQIPEETGKDLPKLPPEQKEIGPAGKVLGAAKDFGKKWLTSKGRLKYTDPHTGKVTDLAERKVGMVGSMNAELRQLENMTAKLRRAVKAEYRPPVEESTELMRLASDKRISEPENFNQQMNAYLMDGFEPGMNVLPKRVTSVLDEMIENRKRLSKEVQGLVTGKLKETIGQNMEVYLHRSYEIYDNPKWGKKVRKDQNVPDSVWNRTKQFLADQRGLELIKEARKEGYKNDGEIENFVDQKLVGEMEAMLESVGSREIFEVLATGGRVLDVVKARKPISPQIREFWGEYKDPYVNYARTISKMSQFIETTKFYKEVRDVGLGKFLWESPIPSHATKIEGGQKFAPINDLFTTKEMAQALTTLEELPAIKGADFASKAMRGIIGASGAVNISKTVLSHQTQVRNVSGGGIMLAFSGRFNPKELKNATATVAADLLKRDNPAQLEKIKDYARLGLLDEAVVTGELSGVLKDISKGDLSITNPRLDAVAKLGKPAFDVYQGVDNVMRIAAFEGDLAKYAKALKTSPKDPALRKKVAQNVTMTYPTYSRVPLAIKGMRRIPVAGNFISFPAEIVRTGLNTFKLAKEEMSTPGLREIGAKRFGSMAATTIAILSLPRIYNHLNDVSSDELKALRRFIPDWSANGNIASTNHGEGKWDYVDLDYTDPYSYLKKPLMAAMRAGGEPDIHYWEAFAEIVRPFSDERILMSKMLDLSLNQTGNRFIWNETDSWDEKATKALAHLGDAFTPGSINSFNKLHKAATGQKGNYDREYDLSDEVVAQFLGLRTSKIDVARSLEIFKLRDFNKEVRSLSGGFTNEIRKKQLTDDEQVDLYYNTNQKRFKAWQSMYRDIEAAKTLGLSEAKIVQAMKKSGVGKTDRTALRNGKFIPYWPDTSTTLKLQREGREISRGKLLNLKKSFTNQPLLDDTYWNAGSPRQ